MKYYEYGVFMNDFEIKYKFEVRYDLIKLEWENILRIEICNIYNMIYFVDLILSVILDK